MTNSHDDCYWAESCHEGCDGCEDYCSTRRELELDRAAYAEDLQMRAKEYEQMIADYSDGTSEV